MLLLAAAWRRFRTRSIRAPFFRLFGSDHLYFRRPPFSQFQQIRPIFDSSVQPGGLIGTLIARVLASGLNTVGATILLLAIAATGLLLATNFSFLDLYEKLVTLAANGSRLLETCKNTEPGAKSAANSLECVKKNERL